MSIIRKVLKPCKLFSYILNIKYIANTILVIKLTMNVFHI
jgi:hypothetical protein